MSIISIIAVIIIIAAVYDGELHRGTAKAKPIHWLLIAAAMAAIIISEILTGNPV